MLLYLLVFFISLVWIKFAESVKLKNFFCLFGGTLLFPTLLATFRSYGVGTDTENYWRIYENLIAADSLGEVLLLGNIEILFIVLSYISEYLGGFPFLLFVYQYLTILFVCLVAYKFRRLIPSWLVVFLYFALFYNMSLNIARQCLAIVYVLYISSFLVKSQEKKFWTFSVLSITIHMSAIGACFLIYVLYTLYKNPLRNRFLYASILMLSIISLWFSFNTVVHLLASTGVTRFQSYAAYAGGGAFDSHISVTDVVFRVVFLLIAVCVRLCKIIPERLSFLYILLILIEMLLLLLGIYSGFAYRIALYLTIFHILFLPSIAVSKRFTLRSKNLFEFFLVLLGLAYWWWIFVFRNNSETIPYSFN